MTAALRLLGSIVAGLALALVLVIAVELFSAVVHPVPPDFDGTMEEMCKHVARYPHWVLAVVVPAWGGTALASAWLTQRIGNRDGGLFVGALLLAAVVFNVVQLPYPMWFKLVMPLAVAGCIALGLRWSGPRNAGPAAPHGDIRDA